MITIYHNNVCSKSNYALELLEEKNIPHEVRFYMDDLLTVDELKVLLQKLHLQPSELLRKQEGIYSELSKQSPTQDEWLELMIKYPELIERPIAVNGQQAMIGRPPERMLDIL